MTGSEEYGTAELALTNLLPSWHNLDSTCNSCHSADGGNITLAELHTGYDEAIYAEPGVAYRDLFTGAIDSASLDGYVLTVTFTVTEDAASTVDLDPADVIPTFLVGLYGWDTKDFIVSPHGRDEDRNRYLELVLDGEETNPRVTLTNAADGTWTVTADLSMWSEMIDDGTVKRAEIGVEPKLGIIVGEIDSHENGEDDDTVFALNAFSRTFDLTTGAFDDDFFQPIVDVQGCNACHEALGTTFHSADRGGSIAVCRMCHVTTNGGSHLEMQSRSLDSYVHAIHSFQDFDSGDIDMTDPVERVRYELHIEHNYPNFTILNCESCHVAGTYDVPSQGASLPGLLSAADEWATDRNIGAVPSYITGPATRACGACHRTHAIKEDDGNKLVALNQHMGSNGYLLENVDGLLDLVIMHVMSLF